jgi:hypothetical protein
MTGIEKGFSSYNNPVFDDTRYRTYRYVFLFGYYEQDVVLIRLGIDLRPC